MEIEPPLIKSQGRKYTNLFYKVSLSFKFFIYDQSINLDSFYAASSEYDLTYERLLVKMRKN